MIHLHEGPVQGHITAGIVREKTNIQSGSGGGTIGRAMAYCLSVVGSNPFSYFFGLELLSVYSFRAFSKYLVIEQGILFLLLSSFSSSFNQCKIYQL